jgi:hypothetical protein
MRGLTAMICLNSATAKGKEGGADENGQAIKLTALELEHFASRVFLTQNTIQKRKLL